MNDIVWKPRSPESTQMWQFKTHIEHQYDTHFKDYHALHRWSLNYPQYFWEELRLFYNIEWDTPAANVCNADTEMLKVRWFEGASFNFAQKLLSRRDDHPALVSISENNERHELSYESLYQQVAQAAHGLKALGVKPGDRVAAVMPNTATTIIAMLAATSMGAIWSSCSPDFGTESITDRLGQIEPKILFICDGHQYQGKQHSALDKMHQLVEAMPSLERLIICPNIHLQIDSLPFKAMMWDQFIKPAHTIEFHHMPFDHPIYIMFSSGTTGKPKCIVHGAGGTLLQHIKEHGLHCDLGPQDNMMFYTTCGWMMWNWTVSALALGTTLTLYEGAPSYPETEHLFSIIENEQITVFGTSAKYLSAIEKAGAKPKAHHHLDSLRLILSTGSPLLAGTYDFVYEHIKSDVQLSSISGGTDIISCFALGNPIMPVYKGALQCLGLGMAVEVYNEDGQSIQQERGELVCTKAFPSMPVFFWNDPDKTTYKKAYFSRFSNVWAHGDFAEITKEHGLVIYGRSDAVLNPGGVRIGTAEIYKQVEHIEEVVDSIVIGQNWHDDVRVVLFVKLQPELTLTETLVTKIKQTIRQNTSPRHVPAIILQVPDIPRTMSGKIVELAVRQVVHGEEVKNLKSLANPEALEFFKHRPELNGGF